jgi:hypothetical protein
VAGAAIRASPAIASAATTDSLVENINASPCGVMAGSVSSLPYLPGGRSAWRQFLQMSDW